MNSYSLKYSGKAQKQLNNMDNSMKLKIIKYIDKNLANTYNPDKFGKALTGNLKGYWRYRVENYRIIAKIEKNQLIILIVNLGKRDRIYIYSQST